MDLRDSLSLVLGIVFWLKYLLLHQLLPSMHYTEQIQVYHEKRNYKIGHKCYRHSLTKRRADLDKICWNLRKRPIVLLIFLVIFFICSEKFNFLSNVEPRCFWNRLLLNRMLLNKKAGWSNFLIFLLNVASCACLIKSGL